MNDVSTTTLHGDATVKCQDAAESQHIVTPSEKSSIYCNITSSTTSLQGKRRPEHVVRTQQYVL